ncbi:tachykinin [Choristoneura fumiferana]
MSCDLVFKIAKNTMGAVRTCLLVITIHILHAVTAQEKRGPAGFVGMRGKKYSDLSHSDYIEMFKRQPQHQYIGGKGKKDWYEIENEEFKRAPMGFIGMRGKKDSQDLYYPVFSNKGGSLIGEIDYSPSDNLDGKSEYPLLNDLLTEYLMRLQQSEGSTEIAPESTEDDMTNEINKRAANMRQFYGVRGKKSESKRPFDLNFRGKFIGVRGKKDLKNSGAQEIKFLLGQSGPWPKRKGQMGFFGMRGKKWTDEASLENESPN